MRTRALGSKLESLQRRLGLVQAVDGIAATATAGIHIHTSDGSQPLATVGIADASRQLARVREEQRRRSEGIDIYMYIHMYMYIYMYRCARSRGGARKA